MFELTKKSKGVDMSGINEQFPDVQDNQQSEDSDEMDETALKQKAKKDNDRNLAVLKAEREINDEVLELRLRNSIKQLIMRKFYDFKLSYRIDPQGLKNRVKMLQNGRYNLTPSEGAIAAEENIAATILDVQVKKLANHERFRFTIMQAKMQTCQDLMRSSHESWSKIMDNSNYWMGNFMQLYKGPGSRDKFT